MLTLTMPNTTTSGALGASAHTESLAPEAMGDAAKSAEHIKFAAFEYSMEHYMGKTAQVHAKLRGLTKP